MGKTLDALAKAERRRRRAADRGDPPGFDVQVVERLEGIERRLSALDEDLTKRGAETEGRLLHVMESRLGELEPRLVRASDELTRRGAETEARLLQLMESRLGELEPRLVREIRREFENALSWNLAPLQRRVTVTAVGLIAATALLLLARC